MNDDVSTVEPKPSFLDGKRFLLLIISAITISFILLLISLSLYSFSGAAQLDLSRPGYIDVRDKTVDSSSDFKNYPNYGAIDQAAIDEFKKLYDEQAEVIRVADAFKNDPLNPTELTAAPAFDISF
ncbi:MAG: hypothetical protein WCQ49_03255 [Candidatus Saccharibacteria bacterium]